MKSIEVSARTIEEAISAGLSKLGCSIADCKVEIIQEGAKGLFGVFGSKPATVRLTPLVVDDFAMDSLGFDLHASLQPSEPPKPRPAQTPAREKHAAPAKKAPPPPSEKPASEKGKMRIAKEPQVVDRPKNQEAIERFKNAPLPAKAADKPAPAPAPKAKPPQKPKHRSERPEKQAWHAEPRDEHKPVPVPENIVKHAPDTLEGIAQAFLTGITERMGVSVQVDVTRGDEGQLVATMYGDTLGILIGRRGETLDALQYLTSLQVNRDREEYVRVTLDTEKYRAKREEALVRLAARMASKAVKTGRKVSLEPMNPYERRILHSTLQTNPNVSTHSEGDEPYRHVVVVPQK